MLSEDKLLKLEAYKSLQAMQNLDCTFTHSFDKFCVIVPWVSIIFAWQRSINPIIGSIVLMASIVILCILERAFKRFEMVIQERYRMMQELEGHLGFCAHKAIDRFNKANGIKGHHNRLRSRIVIGAIVILIATFMSYVYVRRSDILCVFN